MPHIDYTHEELEALGLARPRRQRSGRRVQRPAVPPIVWIVAAAAIVTLLTLGIHQPAPIKQASGSSSTVISANGTLTQTSYNTAGAQTNLKVRYYGWPLTYVTAGCSGTGTACDAFVHIGWLTAFVQLVMWTLLVAVLWSGYYFIRRRR